MFCPEPSQVGLEGLFDVTPPAVLQGDAVVMQDPGCNRSEAPPLVVILSCLAACSRQRSALVRPVGHASRCDEASYSRSGA